MPRADVTMSEALGAVRAGCSSSSSDATPVVATEDTTGEREVPHGSVDGVDWTEVGARWMVRTMTADQNMVKRAKSAHENPIPTDMVVDELTSAETIAWKCASLGDVESDDDELASK